MVNRTTVQDAPSTPARASFASSPPGSARTFMLPGRRLKLHPDDLYALGGHRGGINERWFSSDDQRRQRPRHAARRRV